ncbi:hypothetical protein Tco_1378175 [Tanacetum coccineum]
MTLKKLQLNQIFCITSNDIEIELNEKFLVELRKIMYQGTYNEDMVEHIAKVLKLVDLIYVPGVDSHQLRMKVFPLSLADDANEWWISEGDGKITTWEELVEKFFCRFYPESYDGEDELLDEGENWGIDPLEFLSNLLGKIGAKGIEVYKLTKANGSSNFHGDIQAFLRRLDRQDLNDLYSLVQERFQDHSLEGHDLLLWGDLKMIFDPDESNEL